MEDVKATSIKLRRYEKLLLEVIEKEQKNMDMNWAMVTAS
jgi:hypothetical protein